MLDHPVLLKWFEMAKADEVVIDDEDINYEALENQWIFSPREDELEGLTPEAVTKFVQAVFEARREWLRSHRAAPMLFYCWHDFQARQLRFSLVSASHGRLPFGCQLEETSLESVTTRVVRIDWLAETYFVPARYEEVLEAQEKPFVLPVWVARLP